MKWIGKHPVFSDLLIGGVLLTPPDNQYSYELTLPNDDGTSGQVLSTDGNGVLSWVANGVAVPNALTAGTGVDYASGTTWDGSAANTINLDLTEVIATDGANRVLVSDGDGTLTATGMTYSSDQLILGTTTSGGPLPLIQLSNNNTGADGPRVSFIKLANGADDDELGEVKFQGDDAGGGALTYASFNAYIADATDTEEAGRIEFKVAEFDGTLTTGVIIDGDSNVDGRIDVTIGAGAASVTTIAGDLDIDGDNMTSAGAMTFTPVGKYTITAPDLTGDVFHLDADADTDNIVNIDAGALDIDTTAATTIDAAGSITLTSTATGGDAVHIDADSHGSSVVNIDAGTLDIDASGSISIEGTGTASDISIVTAHTAGTAFHLDANADAGSIVDIDAGILNIDSSGATTITAVGTAEVAGSTVTLDSAANIELEVGATTNYINAGGIYRGGNIGPISDTFIPIMPVDFITPNSYRFPGQIDVVSNGKQIGVGNAGTFYFCQKIIPKGYTASTFRINGAEGGSTASTFTVYENTIGGATPTAVTSAFAFNTDQSAITGRDVVGDGEKFITIVFDPGDTTDFIYGGKITIAKT